jgi:hypothetical protein
MKADPNAAAPNAMTKYATQMVPTRLRTRFDGTSMTVNYQIYQERCRNVGNVIHDEKMTYEDVENSQGDIEVKSLHAQVRFET